MIPHAFLTRGIDFLRERKREREKGTGTFSCYFADIKAQMPK